MTANKCSWFTRFANKIAKLAGHPMSFVVAVTTIIIWALTGPMLGFSDTWQLVINTSTAIVTFLMVFLIQNTQNRDTEAIHIKLDTLIYAIEKADNALLDIEELDAKELDLLRAKYQKLAREGRAQLLSAADPARSED